MIIYTTAARRDIEWAFASGKTEDGLGADVLLSCTEKGTRCVGKRKFDVTLGTYERDSALPPGAFQSNGRRAVSRRATNVVYPYGAVYSEWGWFLSWLYIADPEARVISHISEYQNAEDFHVRTRGRFK